MEQKNNEKKKLCFVITPIGAENSDIRRHIDGIIDECIYPVFENEHNIIVAHKLSKPGSITKQVVENIYKADIIIANLTDLNPNVMYELAFAHTLRKNVIHIMENDGTKLPFDLVTERTIFYTNDFQGAIDLKKNLNLVLCSINDNINVKADNPIYNALSNYGIEKELIDSIEPKSEGKVDAINYIIERLNKIDEKIVRFNTINNVKNNDINDVFSIYNRYITTVHIKYDFSNISEDEKLEILNSVAINICDILDTQVTIKKSEDKPDEYMYYTEPITKKILNNKLSLLRRSLLNKKCVLTCDIETKSI